VELFQEKSTCKEKNNISLPPRCTSVSDIAEAL
jgi:hypothetical protein